ncbi:MAG: NAD/NADP octopine/nopaline dehydrogenase family protein, partial [Desulfobacterales bacterium]|nr:NAD/NADP octopine/nopaline dehydrogenase family protein [Desulfobacterales bacterium]
LLWEHPAFAWTLEPIREGLTIHLEGTSVTGAAKLAGVTTDAGQAAAWSDCLVCSVPAYAHKPFAEAFAKTLKAGQVLVLLPGNLGTLEFAEVLRRAGAPACLLAESDTAPYVCRKSAPDRAVIWGVVPALGVGVFPAEHTSAALEPIARLFPGAVAYADVLRAGLSALNPIVHPPGVLLNAGRVERSRGEFYFYDEGVTPGVVAVIEALDRERLALGAAYGIDLMPVAEGFANAGFGPCGDLWSVINGSRMLTALRAPGQLNTRWLTEDLPYGLATWMALAEPLGVKMPVARSLITLGSALLGRDFGSESRGLRALGIEGLTPECLFRYLATGVKS